jgi:hypothetical protein
MLARLLTLGLLVSGCAPRAGVVIPADAGCPAEWSAALPLCTGAACNEVGKRCTYPGAGDCSANGQCSDAVLECYGGRDGGSAYACGQ